MCCNVTGFIYQGVVCQGFCVCVKLNECVMLPCIHLNVLSNSRDVFFIVNDNGRSEIIQNTAERKVIERRWTYFKRCFTPL